VMKIVLHKFIKEFQITIELLRLVNKTIRNKVII
jgi:hypothetical protein